MIGCCRVILHVDSSATLHFCHSLVSFIYLTSNCYTALLGGCSHVRNCFPYCSRSTVMGRGSPIFLGEHHPLWFYPCATHSTLMAVPIPSLLYPGLLVGSSPHFPRRLSWPGKWVPTMPPISHCLYVSGHIGICLFVTGRIAFLLHFSARFPMNL